MTTLDVSVPVLATNIKNYVLEQNLGRVRVSGVPVLALDNDRENATRQVKEEIRRASLEDNVDSVVLGRARMVHIIDESKDMPLRLIDGVHAAVALAAVF